MVEMETKKEKILIELIHSIFIIGIISIFCIIIVHFKNMDKPSNNIEVCKNVQKLYKDDILFDNFYISCNHNTIEITKELYVRIIEGKDYKVTYKNSGDLYSIEKIED